jgi:hypothetical protein
MLTPTRCHLSRVHLRTHSLDCSLPSMISHAPPSRSSIAFAPRSSTRLAFISLSPAPRDRSTILAPSDAHVSRQLCREIGPDPTYVRSTKAVRALFTRSYGSSAPKAPTLPNFTDSRARTTGQTISALVSLLAHCVCGCALFISTPPESLSAFYLWLIILNIAFD